MLDHWPHGGIGALLLVGVLVGVVCLGAGPASADEHTKENAVNVTEEANFTSTFPFQTDHYPGDQNEENGSIQYFFSPEDSFDKLGVADTGAFGEYLIIDATWIDYSACDVDNTAAFGIDRGSNKSGTSFDVDLVARQKQADFRDDGLTIEFYDWQDIANDPPYMAAEDQIVAEQGARSSAGACLTPTNEPGWYQIQGFLNGTAADNGRNEQPSENAEQVAGTAFSNYIYVCECDSEAEAREQLGPPPNEEGGETPTPEPATETPAATETATATPGETQETASPTATAPPDTDTPSQATQTPNDEPTPTLASERSPTATDTGGTDDDGAFNATPTPGDGPGFGVGVSLLALLSGGLLARRR